MVQKNRDVTFDIMKGLGILLVLGIHYWPYLKWNYHYVHSFVMPMFFLVAGYFSKPALESVTLTIKKNSRRLLMPFVVTQLLLMVWGGFQSLAKHDLSYLIKPGLSLLWGGCDVVNSQWGSIYVGPMWFLPALFWGKTTFEFLISKIYNWFLFAVCVGISVASIVLHKYTNSPWCILQGLSCLVFLSIGYLAKQKLFPDWVYWLALMCWPISMVYSSMEVSDCWYHLYPLDVLGACGGTWFVWWLANQIKRLGVLPMVFSWFGVNSLIVLCFHNFEWFSAISYSVTAHVPFDIQGNWMILFRFALTLVMVVLALQIPVIRAVYGVKK